MCWAWTPGPLEQGPGVSSLRTGRLWAAFPFKAQPSLQGAAIRFLARGGGAWPPARRLGAGFLFLTFRVSPVCHAACQPQTPRRQHAPLTSVPSGRLAPPPPHTPLGLAGLTQFGGERRACVGAHLPV